MTLHLIRSSALEAPVQAEVGVQIEQITERKTKEGKPFLLLAVVDATDRMTLRMWNDHPLWSEAKSLPQGSFILLRGEFALHPTYGIEARRWDFDHMTDQAVEALLCGDAETMAKQNASFEEIVSLFANLADPRFRRLAELFLEDYGLRFRRAAAARHYHHSRRGGLVEHTAQMLRAAVALLSVYPQVNGSLLLTGVLFHDCGKLWETCPEEQGFMIPHDPRAELLGHITIGIELVNALWKKMMTTAPAEWQELSPGSEEARLHLLHLIASHHGELEFGSPVVPKTPEAFLLHAIDTLDAKLESVRTCFETGARLGHGVVERIRPLPGNLVLATWHSSGL